MENSFSIDDYNEFLSSISDVLFYSYDEFKAFRLNELSKEESFMLGIDIAKNYSQSIKNLDKCYFKGKGPIEVFTEDEVLNIASQDKDYQHYKISI